MGAVTGATAVATKSPTLAAAAGAVYLPINVGPMPCLRLKLPVPLEIVPQELIVDGVHGPKRGQWAGGRA